jgi:hypothetical protein
MIRPMTPPPLPTTIRYTLTRNDLISLRMGSLWRNRSIRIFYPIFFVVVFLINFYGGDAVGVPAAGRLTTAAVAAGIPCAIGLGVTIIIALAGAYRKNTGVLGEHEIQLTDWGLIERTDVNQSVHRWPGVGRIVRTADFLIIHVGDAQYLAVPTTAFASVSALDAFEAELHEKHNRAQTSVSK